MEGEPTGAGSYSRAWPQGRRGAAGLLHAPDGRVPDVARSPADRLGRDPRGRPRAECDGDVVAGGGGGGLGGPGGGGTGDGGPPPPPLPRPPTPATPHRRRWRQG